MYSTHDDDKLDRSYIYYMSIVIYCFFYCLFTGCTQKTLPILDQWQFCTCVEDILVIVFLTLSLHGLANTPTWKIVLSGIGDCQAFTYSECSVWEVDMAAGKQTHLQHPLYPSVTTLGDIETKLFISNIFLDLNQMKNTWLKTVDHKDSSIWVTLAEKNASIFVHTTSPTIQSLLC